MERKISISGLQQKKLFPLIIHSMLIQIKTFTIIKKFKEKKLKTIEAIIDKYNYNVSFKLRFFPYSIRISIILVIVINEPRINFVAFPNFIRGFENLSKRIHIWEIVTFENLNLIGSWLENETGREICHKLDFNRTTV